LTIPNDANNSFYTVVVKITWYNAAGALIGWTRRRVDQYAEYNLSAGTYPLSECYQGFI